MAHEESRTWQKYATEYDPIRIGSIDGTDTEPHDRAIIRALHLEYAPNKSVKGDPSHTLFAARFNPRTTQETIRTEFSKFGKIVHCRLVKDIVTGKSKQYAFIEYASSADMDKALRAMHKEYVDGAEILVEREAERRLKGWKPRRLGGGFGGKKESGQLRFGCTERPFKRPIVISSDAHGPRKRHESSVRELKGWCKAFTRTEIILSILEALLLAIFIALLIFVSVHFTICPKTETSELLTNTQSEPEFNETSRVTVPSRFSTTGHDETGSTTGRGSESEETPRVTLPTEITIHPKEECSWTPSHKTSAVTRYFVEITTPSNVDFNYQNLTTTYSDNVQTTVTKENIFENIVNHSEESDGEESDDMLKRNILALVKIRPGRDVTFGCILTIVSRYWTLTAASCIEAIEEVDSLDSFVMVEGWGSAGSVEDPRTGRSHAVSDVAVHPQYRGSSRGHDLVALRAEDALLQAGDLPLRRASMLHYFLFTIGERFTVLGFGRFRSVETAGAARQLRQTWVHALPASQCAASSEAFELRHMLPGQPVEHPPCGAAPLCAGVLHTRGTPCNYCAGTPLLSGAVLYGIMSDNQQCGVACEPAVYVNIASVQGWLTTVLGDE